MVLIQRVEGHIIMGKVNHIPSKTHFVCLIIHAGPIKASYLNYLVLLNRILRIFK